MVKAELNSALVPVEGTPLTPQFPVADQVPEDAPDQMDSVVSARAVPAMARARAERTSKSWLKAEKAANRELL